ncbi:MAG: hypothetical protein KME46_15315 [Brasilonema angustatum HA4187-MV1]|jgi:chromosome segregation ATPase|nr:hypothetical protein [Brasilonema angustatum HA4187-MV1]
MTKKRLSDLLQEEAQKFSPSEGETTIDVAAVSDDNSSTSSDSDTGNEVASAQLKEETQAAETTTSKRTTPTKAELEATVKELKEALEKAQKKEASLVKQLKNTLEKTQQKETSVVNELKETMDKAQKKEASVVKELKETIEKAQQKEASLQQQITDLELDVSKHKILAASLKTELDDAKKAAIQLAEANSQLTETINTLQQKKQNALAPKTYKKSYPLAQRLPEGRPITKDNDSDDKSSPMWLLD